MAASLLSFVVRGLRIFSSSHASLPGCRRILTRPPFRPVPGADSNVESDAESEEDEERAIESALKRRQKAILLKRMKRQLEPPGPPERRLTWNAIEQIKYLRQEFPEEWTLQRLAVGFNVSTDVIKKVLKSKFVPPEVRKMKQDASVSKLLGQISTGSRIDHLQLRSPAKDSAQQLLPFGGDESRLLVSQSSQVLPPPKTSDSSLVTLRSGSPQNNVPKSLVRKQESQNAMPGVISAVSEVSLATSGMVEPAQSAPVEPDQVVLNEKWDGEVLSDHQLEDLANSGLQNSMKVEQKGREFFDSNGNFLYRI
ncbi:neugrin isoform X1 [Pseudophryne corroboree]|uniref:neugrin isoform X1 n=1 Tax=Pseudophryne corroboree TaxID=495146 RepID=UPI0030812216